RGRRPRRARRARTDARARCPAAARHRHGPTRTDSMTVLITTQDLEPAVRLRDAFQEDGLAVELVTPGERVADVPDPKLLILTGGLEDRQARRLAREAAALNRLPVIALFDSPADVTPEARARL